MKLVVLLLGVLFSTATHASSETLRYAIFPAPPFMIFSEDSTAEEITGIDVDIVRSIAKRMGLKIEFIKCTWARALDLMQSGEVDLLSSAYRKPDREKFMRYFDVPFLEQLPVAFYCRTDSGIHVDRYEDLHSMNAVGVQNGASYFKRFDEDAAIRKIPINTQNQLFEMLLAGRFDCAAGYIPRENYYLVNERYRDRIKRSAFVHNEYRPVFMALSRKSELMERFEEMNRINTELAGEGILSEIRERYYRQYDQNPAPDSPESPAQPVPAP